MSERDSFAASANNNADADAPAVTSESVTEIGASVSEAGEAVKAIETIGIVEALEEFRADAVAEGDVKEVGTENIGAFSGVITAHAQPDGLDASAENAAPPAAASVAAETVQTAETAKTVETDEEFDRHKTDEKQKRDAKRQQRVGSRGSGRTIPVRHVYTRLGSIGYYERERRQARRNIMRSVVSFAIGVLSFVVFLLIAPNTAGKLFDFLSWGRINGATAGAGADGDVSASAPRSSLSDTARLGMRYQAVYKSTAPSIAAVRVWRGDANSDDSGNSDDPKKEDNTDDRFDADLFEFSGIIASADGYIITDGIIFDDIISSGQKIESVDVAMSDGAVYDASLVGYDATAGVAALKIDANGLNAAVIGNSDNVAPGEQVAAIGSSKFDNDATWVTDGIINGIYSFEGSEQGEVCNLLQTNAIMSSSSIGGALVNAEGRVIGVNSGSMSLEDGVTGINCAVPINEAIVAIAGFAGDSVAGAIRESIRDDAPVDSGVEREENDAYQDDISGVEVYSGINIDPFFDENYELFEEQVPSIPRGAFIESVDPFSGAFMAGVRRADVVTRVEDAVIRNSNDYKNAMSGFKPGQTIDVEVYRSGNRIVCQVELSSPRE